VHPQLTLPLDPAPATSFETFHVSDTNAVAHRSVRALVEGASADRQILVWGARGAGKSHLLSAACQTVSAQGYRIAYLPGELAGHRDALVGLEQCELVCIDDLQRLGHEAEIELCHCMERCRAAGTMLLFAADRPPEELGFERAELVARLDLGPRFRVGALAGESLRAALKTGAARRSVPLGDDVLDFLLRRFEPDMQVLQPIVERLVDVALGERKRLTVARVRNAFEEGAAPASLHPV